nr:NAD(P)H-dependent oxidoreductase [Anaerovorax odorimutans]
MKGYGYDEIVTAEEFENTDLRNKKILFSISLGESGINLEYYNMLKQIRLRRDCFEGSVGGVIVDGNSELFTKSISREFVFSANRSGCAFPGRPLVEGTRSLKNFNIRAQNLHMDNLGAYIVAGRQLVFNILEFTEMKKERPKILMIHASDRKTSNSLSLWELVKQHLNSCDIKEISLRNGKVLDCQGCPYETCKHFAEEEKCFYGGPIVEEVYPGILEADALVLVCPNYNDAVGANIAAFINRLTALVMNHKFYDKSLFGIVVSGYSGGDIVAQQMISALNMNKTFRLPGHFSLLETANDPKTILQSEGIEARAEAFAQNILKNLGTGSGR